MEELSQEQLQQRLGQLLERDNQQHSIPDAINRLKAFIQEHHLYPAMKKTLGDASLSDEKAIAEWHKVLQQPFVWFQENTSALVSESAPRLTADDPLFTPLDRTLSLLNELLESAVIFNAGDKRRRKWRQNVQAVIAVYKDFRDRLCQGSLQERRQLLQSRASIFLPKKGWCYLTPEATQKIYGNEVKPSQPDKQRYASAKVTHHGGIHFKFSPRWPGREYMVHTLDDLLFQQAVTSPSQLILLCAPYTQVIQPVLATQTVPGQLWQDIPAPQLPPFQVDNFSQQFLLQLLTFPADGKLDNFIVTPQGRYIAIDNEMIFAPPIVKRVQDESHMTHVCSAIFLQPQMETLIDETLRQQLVAHSTIEILLRWLAQLSKEQQYYQQLLQQNSVAGFSGVLAFSFPRGSIEKLQQMLQNLANFLQQKRTHHEIFAYLQPELAQYYHSLRQQKQIAIAEQLNHFQYAKRAETQLQAKTFESLNITIAATTPVVPMMEILIQRGDVQGEVVKQDTLADASTTVMAAIDWKNLDADTIARCWKQLLKQPATHWILYQAAFLTDEHLAQLARIPHLESLEIMGSPHITLSGLKPLRKNHPHLCLGQSMQLSPLSVDERSMPLHNLFKKLSWRLPTGYRLILQTDNPEDKKAQAANMAFYLYEVDKAFGQSAPESEARTELNLLRTYLLEKKYASVAFTALIAQQGTEYFKEDKAAQDLWETKTLRYYAEYLARYETSPAVYLRDWRELNPSQQGIFYSCLQMALPANTSTSRAIFAALENDPAANGYRRSEITQFRLWRQTLLTHVPAKIVTFSTASGKEITFSDLQSHKITVMSPTLVKIPLSYAVVAELQKKGWLVVTPEAEQPIGDFNFARKYQVNRADILRSSHIIGETDSDDEEDIFLPSSHLIHAQEKENSAEEKEDELWEHWPTVETSAVSLDSPINLRQQLLTAITETSGEMLPITEEFCVSRTAITKVLVEEKHAYDRELLDVLLYALSQQTPEVKMYPAIHARWLRKYFQPLLAQEEDYAMIPLDVSAEAILHTETHYWTALIIDRKNQRIFYLDPQSQQNIPPTVLALQQFFAYSHAIILTPIAFLPPEEALECHTGVYTVEIFKSVAHSLARGEIISLTNETGTSLATLLSEIPCGAEEFIDSLCESHLQLLGETLKILPPAVEDKTVAPVSAATEEKITSTKTSLSLTAEAAEIPTASHNVLHGNHLVVPLQIENLSLHLKVKPDFPGMEMAFYLLTRRLVGQCSPMVELWRWCCGQKVYPVLASETIAGEVLTDELLRSCPLQSYAFSQLVLSALITNPGDGNPGNFIGQIVKNARGEDELRLISIDNDRILAPPFENGRLRVATVLFCCDEMLLPLDAEVRQAFLRIDAYQLLSAWLEELETFNKEYLTIFEQDLAQFLQADERRQQSYLLSMLKRYTIRDLFLKIKILQHHLLRDPNLSLMDLLGKVHPSLANHYQMARNYADTPLSRFEWAVANEFRREQVAGVVRYTSTVHMREHLQLLGKNVGNAQEIIAAWEQDFQQARNELRALSISHEAIASAKESLKKGQLKEFAELTEAAAQEEVLASIDFVKDIITKQGTPDALTRQKIFAELVNLRQLKPLQSLVLTHAQGFTATQAQQLLARLTHLHSLKIIGDFPLPAQLPALRLPQLTDWIVEQSNNLTALQLTQAWPQLNYIALKQAVNLTTLMIRSRSVKKINLRGCKNLQQLIIEAPLLQEIDFTDCVQLTDAHLKTIVSQCPQLEQMNLTGCDPEKISYIPIKARAPLFTLIEQSPEEIASWAGLLNDVLSNATSEITLSEAKNVVGWAFKALCQALQWNDSVTAIDVSVCGIGPIEARALAAVLVKNHTIETLNLSANLLKDNGVVTVAQALENHPKIRELWLMGVECSDEGMIAVAKLLQHTRSLRMLVLAGNFYGDKGLQALGKALEINNSVDDLHLGANNFTATGMQALFYGLKKHPPLYKFGIYMQPLSSKDITALANYLQQDSSLSVLQLAGNAIGDAGASILAQALYKKKERIDLGLLLNAIGDNGALAFAQLLKANKNIGLNLGMNVIGDQGAHSLIEAGINEYYLNGNPLSREFAEKWKIKTRVGINEDEARKIEEIAFYRLMRFGASSPFLINLGVSISQQPKIATTLFSIAKFWMNWRYGRENEEDVTLEQTINPHSFFADSNDREYLWQTMQAQQQQIQQEKNQKNTVEDLVQQWEQLSAQKQQDMVGSSSGENRLTLIARSWGYECIDVAGDGNCFFHAVADQLQLDYPSQAKTDSELRALAVDYLLQHPQDYTSFMEGHNLNDFILDAVGDGNWADHSIIDALSKMLDMTLVIIIDDDNKSPLVLNPLATRGILYLGYLNNNHYQSLQYNAQLRPTRDLSAHIAAAIAEAQPVVARMAI